MAFFGNSRRTRRSPPDGLHWRRCQHTFARPIGQSCQPKWSGAIDGGIGRDQYLALIAALLGWLFDGAEMGVFSMVGRRAMTDLLHTSDEGLIGVWFGVVTAGFLVGAATGGVLFGWLGDRIGRVRAMTLSILTYALFTGLCGFATSAWQLGVAAIHRRIGHGG